MALMGGILSTFAVTAAAYLGLLFLGNRLIREGLASVPAEIATEISPRDIDFGKVGWNGKPVYPDPRALLRFPGPPPAVHTCLSPRRGVLICFWIERRALLVAAPHFPAVTPECRASRCLARADVQVAIPPQFLPRFGLAPALIPAAIDPLLARFDASRPAGVSFLLRKGERLWLRSLQWRYEGSYTLSSRPHAVFNFTSRWPALLPSSRPNFLLGACSPEAIGEASCFALH